MTEPTKLLEQLADIRAQQDVLRMDYEAKRTAILAQVQEQLDDLDIESKPAMITAELKATELEGQVKQAVTSAGASIKAFGLHAVYSAPRVTWDSKALDGYASAHPEIMPFRKVGEPSVSIRAAK